MAVCSEVEKTYQNYKSTFGDQSQGNYVLSSENQAEFQKIIK